MNDKITYTCRECGKELESDTGKNMECCGKTMEKLPVCESTDTAEHARLHGTGDACDDGRRR